MMKKMLIVGALIAVLGLLAFLSMPESNTEQLTEPISTKIVAVGKGIIDVEGGIVHVAASRQGIVTDVYGEEGQRVVKNQMLARLDARQPQLNLDVLNAELGQMQAELEQLRLKHSQATRELKRMSALASSKAISRQQLDMAQDACDNTKSELTVQLAKIDRVAHERDVQAYEVSRYDVRAPVGGVIVRRMANPGQGTSTLDVTDLFLILPDTHQVARVELEERFISFVKPGMPVTLTPQDGSQNIVGGKVLRIGKIMGARKDSLLSPQDKVDVRVVEVIVSLDPEAAPLIHGQRVIVKFDKV